MQIKTLISAALLTFGLTAGAQAEVVEGRDYIKLAVPMPQQQADKIEVTEFFGYFCVHCNDMNPVLLKREQNWPADVYLRPIHVVWEPSMLGMARVTAAANTAGLNRQASPALFNAVFGQQINLGDEATFKTWAAAQTGFDSKKLIAAYDSFTNTAQAKEMEELTRKYNIEGTPTVIIGGKYQMKFTGGLGWEKHLDRIEEVIAKVRAERGMKAPAPKAAAKAAKSRGIAAAKAANR